MENKKVNKKYVKICNQILLILSFLFIHFSFIFAVRGVIDGNSFDLNVATSFYALHIAFGLTYLFDFFNIKESD